MNENKVTIIGKAENTKAGAVVISEESKKMYHIDGVSFWENDKHGKLVSVTGVLKKINQEKPEENEPIIQQSIGIIRLILKAEIELYMGKDGSVPN
jgi:hypothetical protein